MDEQMNNNGYQSGSWYSINLLLCSLWYRGIGTACIKHK